jgi:predicted nucleic acid-binding protein
VTATTASDAVVLDSSIWLEYLTDDAKADLVAPYLEEQITVLVPVLVVFEVRKVLLTRRSKTLGDIFISEVFKRVIVPLEEMLALKAADLSVIHKLAMADSIIYATALSHSAPLITFDAHFADLPGVTILS